MDEELWPTEAFGGLTDEQFWDDLASDKPLTTTARTAHQDPGAGNRPATNVRVADRPAATQPAYAVPQPVRSMSSQVTQVTLAASAADAGQPANPGVPPASTGPQPRNSGPQPVSTGHQSRNSGPQRRVTGPQPVIAVAQPGETGGRRRRSSRADEEDPLTSAAFALRPSGPVDGRSAVTSRRPAGTVRERYGEPPRDSSRSGGYDPTAPYPPPGGRHGDTPAAHVDTPPYGEDLGYRLPEPAIHTDEMPPQNGTRRHARHAANGNGNGDRESRPRHSYQQNDRQRNGHRVGGHPIGGSPAGAYPASGYLPGEYWQNLYPQSGRHAGNGHSRNGYHAPYDLRDDRLRLTPRR
ncbi:MAG: hypothetical protein JO037_26365 [Actinobacteria bacterium]|nr:hypothetical protein [Actinomycetota bacterium]